VFLQQAAARKDMATDAVSFFSNNNRPNNNNNIISLTQRAAFKAVRFPHGGDWLFALPIASCRLRLDDEEVRVAVALRLGLPVCVPHQ